MRPWAVALALCIVSSGQAVASDNSPAPQWREFPFAQKLDMTLVHAVTHSAPANLLAAIHRAGVDVRVVRTPEPARGPNPLLSGVPAATRALLQLAEFRDGYEGKVMFRGAPCCALARDTLIVRDTVTTYTLLHEFVQSRLVPSDGEPVEGDLELRFATDFRRLVTYQRRLDADPTRLLDPQWRRDILVAQAAVAERLYARIQIGQSQEAIVEKLLCCEIDERSPYFDAARRAEGLRYGELMIDNAIDLYNTLLESVEFVEGSVRSLFDEIVARRIAPTGPQTLSRADVDAVAAAESEIRAKIAPVRDEILALKEFFRR